MRFLLILFLLSGCAETVKPVVKIEHVVIYPPEQLLEIPPKSYNIDIDKATQKDVAHWILSNEERTMQLENQIILLKQFFKKVHK